MSLYIQRKLAANWLLILWLTVLLDLVNNWFPRGTSSLAINHLNLQRYRFRRTPLLLHLFDLCFPLHNLSPFQFHFSSWFNNRSEISGPRPLDILWNLNGFCNGSWTLSNFHDIGWHNIMEQHWMPDRLLRFTWAR